MLWAGFAFCPLLLILWLKACQSCDEARRERDEAVQERDGIRRTLSASVAAERQRADANYEEAKRLKAELAEANRKLGFVRRAITGPSDLTEIEVNGMLSAGADMTDEEKADQQAKRVCMYKTLAERRSQKPE